MRAYEFIIEGKKTDPSLVSDIKSAYDAGFYPSEIAELLDITASKVNNVLLAYYPNRSLLGQRRTSPDLVQKVKELWNQGHKNAEISKILNITPTQVKIIFRDYFPNREGKRLYHTDDTINQVKNLWDEGKNSTEISELLGILVSQVQNILNKHYAERERRGPGVKGTTPDDINKMAELYRNGETLRSVANRFNLVHGVVRRHLAKRPDWEEIRISNQQNRDKKLGGLQSTTKRMINKPHSKGISAIRRTGGPSGGAF